VDRARALRALTRFDAPMRVEPLGRGLINETWLCDGRYVLQRVSPIFDPAIHHNIHAVTEHLAARGLVTPRLLPARDGAPFADLGEDGIWRLYTFVPGRTHEALPSPAAAREAGLLLGRFHAALDDLDHTFVGMRLGVHDTAAHLDTLRAAVRHHRDHRLHAAVAPLADSMLQAAATLPALPALAPRVCHGDPKIANVVFAEDGAAVCLVDLDTVGPMALAHELGDALRSWCNPAGEVESDVRFDLALHQAALAGWREGIARPPNEAEHAALLHGVEWISLELAARFAADALRESYFGWDRERYATAGDHHLARARGQWTLHRAVVALREQRQQGLES
jgi:Ser/Thr protein kinase RdoA (MazF antagonist)